MTTYNKNDCLANTLYSITRQRTSFPYEVCIVDDGSAVDPESIIREFVPDCKYKRLKSNVGAYKSCGESLALSSTDSNIIVLQSCDVLYAQDTLLEISCKAVTPGKFAMPEVRDIKVKPDMYKEFDAELPYLLSEDAIAYRKGHGHWHMFFSGPRQPDPATRWYFFLGAILKEDIIKTGYLKCAFDVTVSNEMHRLGFSPIYFDNLIGIHQQHQDHIKYDFKRWEQNCK